MGTHYKIDYKVFELKPFKYFHRYILKDLDFSRKERMRLFHSRSPDTIYSYAKVIRKYVKFAKRKKENPFPVNEKIIRKFIDSLDMSKDRGIIPVMKASFQFTQKIRGDSPISFTSSDFIIEGLLREIGANFPTKKIQEAEVKEIHVRKFLLSCLYGKSFCAPYNEKMTEFRTGVRCLISLFCLSRCGDFMELKKEKILFENDCVVIRWGRRKNNQKGKHQTSIIPKIEAHPLCPVSALQHWLKVTKMKNGQFLNAKLDARGKAVGDKGVSRSTRYKDLKLVCDRLKLPPITEKICKALGTR